MCDPVTGVVSLTTVAAYTAVTATVLGAGVSIMGQQQAAHAAEAKANYDAAVSRNNQILAQRAADDATARGNVAADRQKTQANLLIGKERATLAGNGVEVDSGSGLDLTSDTAAAGTLDALTTKSNAAREALGFQTQGMNYASQASMDEMTAANAGPAANLAGIGTALTTTGSVASQWYNFSSGKRTSSLTGTVS